ncbi:MAG: DUF5663 domain-containing protein [Patescibacteria group bacterium]
MTDQNLSPVLDALKLGDLPKEEQEALLLELNELVFKGAMLRIVERMDEATSQAFAQLMESDADEETVEAFLKERVPGMDEAVAETLADLTDDILSATGTNTNEL